MNIAILKSALDDRGSAYIDKGRRLMVQCLFHDDHNPSMSVYKKDGGYRCFGCGARGSWRELCEELGIPVKPEAEYTRERSIPEAPPKVYAYDDLAIVYPKDKRAYAYLKERGVTQEICKAYDVRYDADDNRIVIPIRTTDGKTVSLYTRDIAGDDKLKTPGTDSKSVLFGLDVVVRRFKYPRRLLVVEGEIDAMSAVRAGWPTVSTMGVIPTDPQVKVLSRFPNVIYLTDRDVYARGDFYMIANQVRALFRKHSGGVRVDYLKYKDAGCKDVNDILKKHGLRALKNYLDGLMQ